MKQSYIALLLATLCTSACSTIIEGRSQEIKVNTTPAGANCQFVREGHVLGAVASTPGSLNLKKTKEDITIKCNKPDYAEGKYLNHSDVAAATFGNIILGGLIGWAVDSATGADNKYDNPVNITLIKNPEPIIAPAIVPAPITSLTPAPTFAAPTPTNMLVAPAPALTAPAPVTNFAPVILTPPQPQNTSR